MPELEGQFSLEDEEARQFKARSTGEPEHMTPWQHDFKAELDRLEGEIELLKFKDPVEGDFELRSLMAERRDLIESVSAEHLEEANAVRGERDILLNSPRPDSPEGDNLAA